METQMNYAPLLWFLQFLTFLMMIDCAVNKRDLQWFIVLLFLGPLGGIVYLVYHWQYVTFPFRVATLFSASGPSAIKRCPRCFRPADRLLPFTDARSTLMLCDDCLAEMKSSRSR